MEPQTRSYKGASGHKFTAAGECRDGWIRLQIANLADGTEIPKPSPSGTEFWPTLIAAVNKSHGDGAVYATPTGT